MDGMAHDLVLEQTSGALAPWRQHTIRAAISCVGTGLHSGKRVQLTVHPAEPHHGIIFRRTDLGRSIPARFDHVGDTRLCTMLTDPAMASARIGTVEHILAALAGLGVDNALIELDGPEVPILDGSAEEFVFLLDCAGIVEQTAPRTVIEIRRPVRVSDGAAFAELRPAATSGRVHVPTLDLDLSIDFAAAAIGQQACALRLTPANFRNRVARARTFALAQEVEQLQAAGLAQGGSLDNAIVVDGARVLNPGGLRMDREFAYHKLLDAVGDLALCGAALHGRFIGHRSGHALNNRLLRALFADATAWREIASAPLTAAAA